MRKTKRSWRAMKSWIDARYSGGPKMQSEFWQSSKYNFQDMDWRELQSTWVEDLGMRAGPAISSLKKSWKMYKLAILQGDEQAALHYSALINRLQDGLGLPLSSFL
jgi:hypothetical protein